MNLLSVPLLSVPLLSSRSLHKQAVIGVYVSCAIAPCYTGVLNQRYSYLLLPTVMLASQTCWLQECVSVWESMCVYEYVYVCAGACVCVCSTAIMCMTVSSAPLRSAFLSLTMNLPFCFHHHSSRLPHIITISPACVTLPPNRLFVLSQGRSVVLLLSVEQCDDRHRDLQLGLSQHRVIVQKCCSKVTSPNSSLSAGGE